MIMATPQCKTASSVLANRERMSAKVVEWKA